MMSIALSAAQFALASVQLHQVQKAAKSRESLTPSGIPAGRWGAQKAGSLRPRASVRPSLARGRCSAAALPRPCRG
ncbi:exported hypothetical protein [Candidatus Contendobacter odensis Run_B_J11]|uniref:Uncharacterized protein n=1 Tax=Candidatus Contendobacter odensis Run_B_J11 TaxID=1400861 RepID=A0A7U7GEK5_9GAMM|nr:exported hypothetical protein [Candidatus Contendobacter odensis Run_B_J11]